MSSTTLTPAACRRSMAASVWSKRKISMALSSRPKVKAYMYSILMPPVEFDVFHDADAGGVQALDGGVRLVEAEDQHGLVLAPESEGVHVLDIDAAGVEQIEQPGEAPGTVRHLDRHHFGHVHQISGLFEDGAAPFPIGHDEAEKAELLGIGQGERVKANAGVRQHPARLDHLAGPIFEEQRQLMDLHEAPHLSGFFGRSRVALCPRCAQCCAARPA